MSQAAKAESGAASVPAISGPLLRFFLRIVRGQLRRNFHAVRVVGLSRLRALAAEDAPVLVYMNHSSWWDPMVSYLLSQAMPRRKHFAPMDAASLRRYAILRHLGVFPVELRSARGGVQFLRVGESILRTRGVLWVTPQGRFADVRERPLEFKAGISRLALRVPECICVPLAIEYSFWNEKTPEILVEIGPPQQLAGGSATAADAQLRQVLDETMGDLAERVRSREPRAFPEIVLRGRTGVGGFYAFGQRIRAWLLRRPYDPSHTPGTEAAETRRPEQPC